MKRKGCLFWFGVPVLVIATIIMSILFLHSQRVCISQMRVIPDEEVMLEAMRHMRSTSIRFANRDVARAYLKDNPNCCHLYRYGDYIGNTHPDGRRWLGDGGQMAYLFLFNIKTHRERKYIYVRSEDAIVMSSCNVQFNPIY
jgi:hypothetical protein